MLDRKALKEQQMALIATAAMSMFDSFSDDSDDISDSDSDDGEMVLHALVSSITVLNNQVNNTYLEDTTIEWGQRKRIEDFEDADCLLNFRFRKEHLQLFAELLWPRISIYLQGNQDNIVVDNRYTAPYETCLLVYLYKMHRPVRYRPDCEQFFGMRINHLSKIMRTFGNALYMVAQPYMNNPYIWEPYFPHYASLIRKKSDGVFENAWGFIDATFRTTCRPKRHQKSMYSGYKKKHGIKFQCLTTPDGYVACLEGGWSGRMSDTKILQESELLEALNNMMPFDNHAENPVYHLLGDMGYPISATIVRGFAGVDRDTVEADYNKALSHVRVVVEWTFNGIATLWAHLDCHNSMQLLKQPVAQQYINGAFLMNIHTSFYGNNTNTYFNASPLTVRQYLELVDE